MNDIIVGILAVVVGLLLCFRGYWAMRYIISVWGAFVGFALVAGIFASVDGGFLITSLAWVLAIFSGLIFAAFAYFYYSVAVVLAMGSFGFMIGGAALATLGVNWNWVIIIGAVAVGLVLALFAIAARLPKVLLVIISALAGAAAVVGGIMLLSGQLDTSDFTSSSVTAQIADEWYWYASYLAIAVIGVLVQTSRSAREEHYWRESWERDRAGASSSR